MSLYSGRCDAMHQFFCSSDKPASSSVRSNASRSARSSSRRPLGKRTLRFSSGVGIISSNCSRSSSLSAPFDLNFSERVMRPSFQTLASSGLKPMTFFSCALFRSSILRALSYLMPRILLSFSAKNCTKRLAARCTSLGSSSSPVQRGQLHQKPRSVANFRRSSPCRRMSNHAKVTSSPAVKSRDARAVSTSPNTAKFADGAQLWRAKPAIGQIPPKARPVYMLLLSAIFWHNFKLFTIAEGELSNDPSTLKYLGSSKSRATVLSSGSGPSSPMSSTMAARRGDELACAIKASKRRSWCSCRSTIPKARALVTKRRSPALTSDVTTTFLRWLCPPPCSSSPAYKTFTGPKESAKFGK
mmetsp:Transcript_144682/g.360630  ORF Transcript_144682/g.360630 Transcript_144682/m.360630 type:complete len:357 (-) Transcript_144682:188-1258(-)